MVAASKLRAIQTRAENSRGLWQPFTALLGDAPSKFITDLTWSVHLFQFNLFPINWPSNLSFLLQF